MEVNIEEVLKNLREIIGNQAQEIAILKSSITELTKPTPQP